MNEWHLAYVGEIYHKLTKILETDLNEPNWQYCWLRIAPGTSKLIRTHATSHLLNSDMLKGFDKRCNELDVIWRPDILSYVPPTQHSELKFGGMLSLIPVFFVSRCCQYLVNIPREQRDLSFSSASDERERACLYTCIMQHIPVPKPQDQGKYGASV